MPETLDFDDEIKDHMKEFKRIKESYLICVQKFNNLQDRFDDSQKELKIAQEREAKKSQILLTSQNICKQQLATIKNLRLLIEEHNTLKNYVEIQKKEKEELVEQIKALKVENDLQLDLQSINFENEIEKLKENYLKQIQELQNEITVVVVTSDIQKNELENEIKNLKVKHEDELKILKNNNNRLESTVFIYEKQKLEAEEKCRILEEEKKHYLCFKPQNACENYLKNQPKYKSPKLNRPIEQNVSQNLCERFTNAMKNKNFNSDLQKSDDFQNKPKQLDEYIQNNLDYSPNKNNIPNKNNYSNNNIRTNSQKYDYFNNFSSSQNSEKSGTNTQENIDKEKFLNKPQKKISPNNRNRNYQNFTNFNNFSNSQNAEKGCTSTQENIEPGKILNKTPQKKISPTNKNRNYQNFIKPNDPPKRGSYYDSDISSDSEYEKSGTSLSRSFQAYKSSKNYNKPQRIFSKSQNVPSNMMPLPVVSGKTNQMISDEKDNDDEPKVPSNKKRKLYNPNDIADLDKFFVP